MNGHYIEKLKTGGELVVGADSWQIKYYFKRSDPRYSGKDLIVPGDEIDSYISAWQNNFEKYLELKENTERGVNCEVPGEKGMNIRVGIFRGVCLQSYHMSISTKEKLDSVINDYKYARDIAPKIMTMLKSL